MSGRSHHTPPRDLGWHFCIAFLLLVSSAFAQYLEHWLPLANPTAAGAVFWPIDLVYSTTSDKFYAYGMFGWVAVIDGRNHRIVKDIPVERPESWQLARTVWSWRNNKAYFRDWYGVAVVNCLTDSIEADISVSRWGAAGIAYDDSNNCLAVASFDSSSVLLIDGVTNEVRARLSTTRRPYQVTWDSRNNRYFVLQTNSYGVDTAFITVFDAATGAVLDSFPLAAVFAVQPEMAYVPTSNKIYVPCESSIVVIDAATLEVLKYLPGHAARLCWNSVHNRLYCVGVESTLVVDCGRDSIIGSIPVGSGLPTLGFSVVYNPADDKLYLWGWPSDSLCIVDGSSNVVLARLPVTGPDLPRGVTAMVWVPGEDRVYATLYPDVILALDGRTNRYCDSIRTCRLVDGLVFNPTLNRLYIISDLIRDSIGHDGRVLSVDPATNQIGTWIGVGACSENDVVLVEGGTKLYCTSELDGTVDVVDCVRETLLKRFDAAYPKSLAYDSIRHRVFCVDNFWRSGGGGALLVFDSRADTAIAEVSIPLPSPRFVVWFPTVNKVYVQNWTGTLAVFDGDSFRFQKYIESPASGMAPCCNFKDNKLYTGNNWGTPGLVVIDAVRDTVIAVFDSFASPWAAVWNQATDKIYTGGDMPFAPPNTPPCIIAVDGATDSLLKIMPIPEGMDWPEILLSHPFLDRVYCEIAGYPGPGGVGFIDCTRDSLFALVTCPLFDGMVSTLELAVDPSLGRVYLADANRVFVLRDASPGIGSEDGVNGDDRAIECFPNPMTGELTIRLGLPAQDWTEFAIYDCTGRMIRELGRPGIGNSVWHWDGTDRSRKAVPPGVYFVRLQVNRESLTRKVVLAQQD